MHSLISTDVAPDATNLFLGLHILLNLLAFFVIAWVFYELHSGKKTSETFFKAKLGMATFLVFLAFAWIIAITKNNFFAGITISEKQNLFLFLSKIKNMLFLLLPLYSFIVYLQLGHASSIMDNAKKQKMIVSIKWQVFTIVLMLVALIILGYLLFGVLEGLTGGGL